MVNKDFQSTTKPLVSIEQLENE